MKRLLILIAVFVLGGFLAIMIQDQAVVEVSNSQIDIWRLEGSGLRVTSRISDQIDGSVQWVHEVVCANGTVEELSTGSAFSREEYERMYRISGVSGLFGYLKYSMGSGTNWAVLSC